MRYLRVLLMSALPLAVLAMIVGLGLLAAAWSSTQASEDSDGDGVPDAEDNCPAWPNPDQSQPWWALPVDDPDCDGWTTADEQYIGTDPNKHCADTPERNDEPPPDAWPPDFDDDQKVNILDIVLYLPLPICFEPGYGFLCGQYIERYDLNADGSINILDIVRLTPPVFNESCTP